MNRIKGLDGLRAVAFFLVFFFHAEYGYFGWIGVQLFFVLSGFLITGILLDMKKLLPTAGYFVKFYGRRFLRIFPLYYFYLFLATRIVTFLLEQKIRRNYMNIFWEQFPYAVGYVYNFFMATSHYDISSFFLTHLWSLAVEEQFYILWPLIIFFTPVKYLKKVFMTVIGLAVVFRIAVMVFYQFAPFKILGDAYTAIYVLPFSHFDAFAFGAILTLGISVPKAKQQFYILLVGIPLLGLLTDYLAIGQWNFNNGWGLPLLLPNAYKPIWGYSMLNYLFMVLIYGIIREGWFNRLLEHPWMRYLGIISYGLYVYHYAILWLVSEVVFPGINQALRAILSLALTILIASISFRFMEKPISDLKDRWFPFRPARDQAQKL